MHTAEVEEIISQKDDFENIVYGIIKSVKNHPDADSLKVCMVDWGEAELIQIVCGGSNLVVGQGIALAKIGASVLWHGQGEPVIMKKTAIRWVDSYGMICASEEIKLKEEFPAATETEILDLSHITAQPGDNLAEVLGKDDVILEIDNKAINHRPDLFSHIGIAREIAAISEKKLGYSMTRTDFTSLPDLDTELILKGYSLISQIILSTYMASLRTVLTQINLLETYTSDMLGTVKSLLLSMTKPTNFQLRISS